MLFKKKRRTADTDVIEEAGQAQAGEEETFGEAAAHLQDAPAAETAAQAGAPATDAPVRANAPAADAENAAVEGNAAGAAPSLLQGDPEAERREFEEFRLQRKAMELRRLLRMIDHTQLKQTATVADIKKLCREAREIGFASVCVQPVYVAACNEFLRDVPQIKIACVVGFPMGENKTETKVFEAKRAVADGADEIDMVACISAIKNGDYGYVKREIKKIVKAVHGATVKVILETSLLTAEEMRRAAACCAAAGAAFVKTSTGYFGGATVEAVRTLKDAVRDKCAVKASGGIRSQETFCAMVDAGADRIGTSSGVEIAESLKKQM